MSLYNQDKMKSDWMRVDPKPSQNSVFMSRKVTHFERRHMMDTETCSHGQRLLVDTETCSHGQRLQEPPELDRGRKGICLALCWLTALWTP